MDKIIHTLSSPEDIAQIEMLKFINEGILDLQNNDLYEIDDVFDQLESRYKAAIL